MYEMPSNFSRARYSREMDVKEWQATYNSLYVAGTCLFALKRFDVA